MQHVTCIQDLVVKTWMPHVGMILHMASRIVFHQEDFMIIGVIFLSDRAIIPKDFLLGMIFLTIQIMDGVHVTFSMVDHEL